MRVRWTTDAADDLERIYDYIAESRPESARRVAKAVVEGIAALETFPYLGRRGRVEQTPRQSGASPATDFICTRKGAELVRLPWRCRLAPEPTPKWCEGSALADVAP